MSGAEPWPAWWWPARRRAAEREASAVAALAPTIDLIVIVLGSGGTVSEAVSVVAAVGPVPVRSAFASVQDRAAAGILLSDALAVLYRRLPPPFQPLVGALISADRDGGTLTVLLGSLADDAEQARRRQVELLSKRLAVTITVPLVLCLLPAAVLGALVPLIVVAVRQLGA